jgi:hypothetical protein
LDFSIRQKDKNLIHNTGDNNMAENDSNKDLLGGLISEEAALEYTEAQWRVIQFKFMCGLQGRMLSLEHKIGMKE